MEAKRLKLSLFQMKFRDLNYGIKKRSKNEAFVLRYKLVYDIITNIDAFGDKFK